MATDKEKSGIENLADEAPALQAYKKLQLTHVDIEVPEVKSALSVSEESIKLIDQLEMSKEEKDKAKKDLKEKVAELLDRKIIATLVPLSVHDIIMVRGYVAEAAKRAAAANFDEDVSMFMVAEAELCATIFYALRKRDSRKEHYFDAAEDVATLDQETKEEIGLLYRENFILTEDERKKS